MLRVRLPNIRRPYRSPLGIPGAAIAILIAAVTFVFLFLNLDYRLGVVGAAIWFLCGIAWFALHARKRLILAPEEEFALAHAKSKAAV